MDWSQFEPTIWELWLSKMFATPAHTIALAAVFVSLVGAWSSWRHGGLSVLPAFATWADYPSEDSPTCTVTLSNKGFGPGIIQSFEVWHGHHRMPGRAHKPMRNLIDSIFDGHYYQIGKVSGPEKGHPFGAGEDLVLAKFEVDPEIVDVGDEYFETFIGCVSLVVRYRDIYGRRWVYTVDEFVGNTYRRAWWNIRYLWARFIQGRKV